MKLIKKIKQPILSRISLIFIVALICMTFAGCVGDTTTGDSTTTSTITGAKDSVYDNYVFKGYSQLVKDTASVTKKLYSNPHDSHFGTLKCSLCHYHDNGTSQFWCTKCHIGMKAPDGWTTYPIGL